MVQGRAFITGTCYISYYSACSMKNGFPTNTGKPFIFHGILVGAVGIEPSSPVQTRKLFIPRSDKNYKNDRNAEVRYTADTRSPKLRT